MNAARWNIRNIYLYLVCFVLLLIMVFSCSNLVYNLSGIAYPGPGYLPPGVAEGKFQGTPAENEALRRYEMKYQNAQQRTMAVRESIRDGFLLLLVVPLYIYHWRRIQAENGKPEA
ncbi:MAG: hypothetical protein ACM3QZ_14860 [Solirubrobacterales bacterium]